MNADPRILSTALNRPGTPASVTAVINAGIQLWRERPAEVDRLFVSVGHLTSQIAPITENDWTQAWGRETAYPPLQRGHTYRVYAQYNRPNGMERRVFTGVKVVDANALVAVSGIKVGEMEL